MTGDPAGLVEFDDIAMFLVPSLDSFRTAVEDPYYLSVVEPDEHNLMDKSAPGRGVVASFQGLIVPVVQGGVDATGNELGAEVQESRSPGRPLPRSVKELRLEGLQGAEEIDF